MLDEVNDDVLPSDLRALKNSKLSEAEWIIFKKLDEDLKNSALIEWNNTEAGAERVEAYVEKRLKKKLGWTCQSQLISHDENGILKRIIFRHDRPGIFLAMPFLDNAPPSIIPPGVMQI